MPYQTVSKVSLLHFFLVITPRIITYVSNIRFTKLNFRQFMINEELKISREKKIKVKIVDFENVHRKTHFLSTITNST